MGQCLAEFAGTMIILLFGCGVGAMTTLFATGAPGEVVHGGWTNITIGWGLGVMLGVALSARVSGGHLNPAVTLALAVFRGFPWAKVAPYTLAQTLGAFCGAGLVFFNYRAAFTRFDPGLERTAGIFTTFPAFPEIPSAGFFDQVLGTALLVLLVFALTDKENRPAPGWAIPLLVGLLVVAIGISFGRLHGYAINPARDFGPRLLVTLLGFRNTGLNGGDALWWIPVAGPLAGGLIGAGVYDLMIRPFLPHMEEGDLE